MKTRNSNLEILRLFCIFGIVLMHSVSSMNVPTESFSWQLAVSIFISSIFDTGVTCFILISGYFGIRPNLQKMLKLATMVWTYSIAGILIQYSTGQNISFEDLVKSFLPIVSRKYWFITCYFWLVALTPWLNQIPEKMKRADFEKLLGTLLILFSVIPTFFYFEIMQDAGRGMAHMIMIYLLGRYIRIYHDIHHKLSRLFLTAFLCIFLTFILNFLLTSLLGYYFAPFTRNSSLTIIITSIMIFLIFKELPVQNRLINRIAAHTLAIYIFEKPMRSILTFCGIDPSCFNDKWFVYLAAIAFVFLTIFLCIFIDVIREFTLGKLDPYLYRFIIFLKTKIHNCFISIQKRRE